MARILRCDRCSTQETLPGLTILPEGWYRVTFMAEVNGPWELCPACVNALDIWLSSGEDNTAPEGPDPSNDAIVRAYDPYDAVGDVRCSHCGELIGWGLEGYRGWVHAAKISHDHQASPK
jgi:hypothetical protein